MASVSLGAVTRSAGKPNHVRRAGRIPAVVYGKAVTAYTVAIDGRELQRVLGGGINQLISLEIDGQTTTVMVKQIQRHPLRGHVLHVDFHAVALDEPIHARVPVIIHGEESVTARGGIVQHQLREIEVSCLPGSVPRHLEVDIAGLHVGEHVSAGDVSLPPSIRLVTEPDEVVVTVVSPRVSEEDRAEAEEAEQEPAAAEQPK
ncbi:MAG: 50S ribosomal protein L25 [Bacillota bacterium]|nr:50S ribosomal protein L25 [Bacillota bacterium]